MCEKRYNDLFLKVVKMEHDIYGNGAKGMVQQIKEVHDNVIRTKQAVRQLQRIIYLAMGGGVVALFIFDKIFSYLK